VTGTLIATLYGDLKGLSATTGEFDAGDGAFGVLPCLNVVDVGKAECAVASFPVLPECDAVMLLDSVRRPLGVQSLFDRSLVGQVIRTRSAPAS